MVIQGHVRAHKVVIGDEQSKQNHRSVERFEPRGRSNVLIEGSIETFDKLLVWAIFSGLFVEVFQPDDLFMLDFVFSCFVEEVEPSCIGRVPISHQGNVLIVFCCTNGFVHRSHSRQSGSVVREMICRDGSSQRRDKKPDIMVFSKNLDVGFVTHRDLVDLSLFLEIEAVKIAGYGLGVVEHSLPCDVDVIQGS